MIQNLRLPRFLRSDHGCGCKSKWFLVGYMSQLTALVGLHKKIRHLFLPSF